jgi:hypothetical protein
MIIITSSDLYNLKRDISIIMKQKQQYTLIPLIQVFPLQNNRSFWKDSYMDKLRLMASVNFFMSIKKVDRSLVFDMNQIPATKFLCEKNKIELMEYYLDQPEELAKGISVMAQNDRSIELIIVQYFASRIELFTNLLVLEGFEVIDQNRKYPLLYKPGTIDRQTAIDQPFFDSGCPMCNLDNTIYMEGVQVCTSCGYNMDG